MAKAVIWSSSSEAVLKLGIYTAIPSFPTARAPLSRWWWKLKPWDWLAWLLPTTIRLRAGLKRVQLGLPTSCR
ncbi:hypothetical protein KIMH_04540 [Bombiscardovia apis]|uniref:Uncharacterized protein n=1 Tax=Bombiscardovia apis TaxID=2932182 RepID=A0ABM8BBN7_9BIFI|nr:hypothetical protein KIMH_04540 [Bombiscardovia apis]